MCFVVTCLERADSLLSFVVSSVSLSLSIGILGQVWYLIVSIPDLCNLTYFVEKNNIFLRICLCIFESDAVKSDCPVQIFRKMMKYLKITLLVLLFFWRY